MSYFTVNLRSEMRHDLVSNLILRNDIPTAGQKVKHSWIYLYFLNKLTEKQGTNEKELR